MIGWARTDSYGNGVIEVSGSLEPVAVEWSGYFLDDGSYSASYFGEQYIGIFKRAGESFIITETYNHMSITNGGKTVKKFRLTSKDGVCCTEIVRALFNGKRLKLDPASGGKNEGQYCMALTSQRDFTLHEADTETISCLTIFDLENLKGSLQRSCFRDAST